VKVERTRSFNAEVVLHGDTLEESRAYALELAAAQDLTFVHPYDDEAIVAGQGTVGLEMLHAVPELDTLVVAVGGGGLIAGIAVAAKAIKPGIEIVGVQALRFPNMFNAVKHQALPQGPSTIAEGIAVGAPGRITQAIIEQDVDDLLLVDEGDIEQAIVMLLEIEKTLAEGAGAVPLAAVLAHRERFLDKRVGVVLSGGNIDPLMLAGIIERGLVRTGRLTRLVVEMRDLPSALAEVTGCLAELNANIEAISHQRAFTSLPVQTVEAEFVLQTRSHDHVRQVIEALAQKGFQATLHLD
jgi:threonine dehydratase